MEFNILWRTFSEVPPLATLKRVFERPDRGFIETAMDSLLEQRIPLDLVHTDFIFALLYLAVLIVLFDPLHLLFHMRLVTPGPYSGSSNGAKSGTAPTRTTSGQS